MADTIRLNRTNVSTTPILSSKTRPGLPDLPKSKSKKPAVPRASISTAKMADTIRVNMTPILSSKTRPSPPDLSKSKSKKPAVPRAPRIDIEPLYTTIKSGISDSDWPKYKTSLTSFLLGNLNQEELSQRLDRILVTRELEHAHNAFMMGMYANVWRDPPEAGTASWVSSSDKPSSDKPSSGVVKGTGDKGKERVKETGDKGKKRVKETGDKGKKRVKETGDKGKERVKETGDKGKKRVKHEAMQSSRRERKRLKTTAQDTRGERG